MRMRNTVFIALFFLIALQVLGCHRQKAITVNRTELEEAKSKWNEPKVSIWYYIGSEDGYHFYLHRDRGGDMFYRVSEAVLEQKDTFPLTRIKKKWTLMHWGVHKKRNE